MKRFVILVTIVIMTFLVITGLLIVRTRLAQTTRDEMNRLAVQVHSYYLSYGVCLGGPDALLDNVVQTLSADTRTRDEFSRRLGTKRIARGLDAWGRPIHVKTNPTTNLMELRSSGSNGIDEFGQGDDIVENFIIGK